MITGPPTVVATDTSMLVNFLQVDRVDILGSMPGHRFTIVQEVDEEVTQPVQRVRLQAGLDNGMLDTCVADDLREIEIYAALPPALGRGERACLAVAQNRGWSFGSDDNRAVREAVERLGTMRILNTPQTILMAIRADVISVQEADRIKRELEEQRRFRMAFPSFQMFFPPHVN